MANTPEDDKTRGRKQARKADFRNKAEASRSEAKWFNPEPREEASTALPETPRQPNAASALRPDKSRPGALAAGGMSDSGDKSRNFETSRHAAPLEPEQAANRGLSADTELTQNRHAESRDVTNLGTAPYQGTGPTGEGRTPGAGLEAGQGTPSSERDLEREASHEPGAASGMAPADQLGTREAGHPGRRTPHDQPGPGTTATPRAAESPEDMRDRQTRKAGVDPRGMEKQGKNEGPNAKQTQKRGVGDDTPRH